MRFASKSRAHELIRGFELVSDAGSDVLKMPRLEKSGFLELSLR